MTTNSLAAILAPAVRAIHTPEAMQRLRRVDLAVTDDGRSSDYALPTLIGHLVADWYIVGTLVVGTTQNKQYRIAVDGTIERFDLNVKIAPVGADLIAQLNQNGVSLGTATIADGTLAGSLALDAPCVAGDLLTIDITQIGSTVAGSSLSAFATYREERG